MKTANNKKGNASAKEILRFRNYFNYLELSKLVEELDSFFNYNFNLFNSIDKKNVEVGIQPERFLKFIDKKNNSYFEVECIPNIIEPTTINVTLSNLNGHLVQRYTINFDDIDELTTITYKKYHKSFEDNFSSSVGILKLTEERVFDIDSILVSKHTMESYTGTSLLDDSSYAREENIDYDKYSNNYIKYLNIIGEGQAYYKPKTVYTMFNGIGEQDISSKEYSELKEQYYKEYPKIKYITVE